MIYLIAVYRDKGVCLLNKVTVRINGTEYSIKGNESDEYLRKVGETVNKMIHTILEKNYMVSSASASILTALNAVDERFKVEEKLSKMQNSEGSVHKDVIVLTEEIERLKKEVEKLNEEKLVYEALLNEEKKGEDEDLLMRDKEIKRLETELHLTMDSAREYRDENENISKMNKELKFELQSYKYKVLDLQKKLFDSQLSQVKEKKEKSASPKDKPQSASL
jgi:cell division protein ZapA